MIGIKQGVLADSAMPRGRDRCELIGETNFIDSKALTRFVCQKDALVAIELTSSLREEWLLRFKSLRRPLCLFTLPYSVPFSIISFVEPHKISLPK